MRVVLPEIVGADLHRNGYIEPEITQAMLRVLEPGSCCIDVGAHYGYHSVVAALLVGSCGSVLAIEPSSRTRRLLMENVEGLSQVRVLGIAVLDTRSTVELRDFGAKNSALSTVMEAARVPGSVGHSLKHRARRVDALSLDDIVGQQKIKPAFVKIDAEGAEIAVLNGMQATLERDRPVVTLEVGDYDGGSLSRVSITKLGDAGYIGLEYLSGAFIRHRARDSYGYGNLVFVPEESSEAWLAG